MALAIHWRPPNPAGVCAGLCPACGRKLAERRVQGVGASLTLEPGFTRSDDDVWRRTKGSGSNYGARGRTFRNDYGEGVRRGVRLELDAMGRPRPRLRPELTHTVECPGRAGRSRCGAPVLIAPENLPRPA